jgi:hypothetical protein
MPAQAPARFARDKLSEAGLQQRARTSGRRYFRIEFLLTGMNKIGDCCFQFLAARTAFPARVKMGMNQLLVMPCQLVLYVQEQLLVGKM